MSMPVFPESKNILTREEAINAILTSIAAEELALSHIINAEGEKIQQILECAKKRGCSRDDMMMILSVNESASSLIEKITDMQIILKTKMNNALKCLHGPPSPPTPPPPPPPPPPCYCTAEFHLLGNSAWYKGKAAYIDRACGCKNGSKIIQEDCETRILLPYRQKYRICLDLTLVNTSHCSVSPFIIELEIRSGNKIIHKEHIHKDTKTYKGHLTHSKVYDIPEKHGEKCGEKYGEKYSEKYGEKYGNITVTARLLSPEKLRVIDGIISVAAINV